MDDMSVNAVSKGFETDFLAISLQKQIAGCDSYELAPQFLEFLPNHQPILEAGCGSGRWCAWFKANGWESTGLDWSEALCKRAREEIPGVRFVSGDMQHTEFPDEMFGSLVALGSVEHVVEGPVSAMQEFYRILRPGGVAIVSVPYGGILRRCIRLLTRPVMHMRNSRFFRKCMNKPARTGISYRNAAEECRKEWFPQFMHTSDGWCFFQYEFNRRQMRSFIEESGFLIDKEFVSFSDEGVLHNFGKIAARWDQVDCAVRLTVLGRFLKRTLPLSLYGHMLCYILRKP